MTFKEYFNGFFRFIILFIGFGILLLSIPKLEIFGVFLIFSILILLVLIIKSYIEKDNSKKEFIFWSHIFMLLCFLIIFLLTLKLGGIINTSLSTILTLPIIFFYFGFIVENKYKGYINYISIIRLLIIFIYIFSIFTFDFNILGIQYTNPLLGISNDKLINMIINSIEFQRAGLLLFLINIFCAISTFSIFNTSEKI